MSFSKDESTQWVVLVVGVLATLYLVLRGRAKRRKDPFAAKPVPFGVSQQKQIERDMSNLMVEMLETARQMTAQLDTRAARLELLLKEADAKLAAMKKMTVEGGVVANAETSAVAEVLAGAVESLPVETPPNPRHGDIYSLADQGRSAAEIARRLNRPNGEVEVILALRAR